MPASKIKPKTAFKFGRSFANICTMVEFLNLFFGIKLQLYLMASLFYLTIYYMHENIVKNPFKTFPASFQQPPQIYTHLDLFTYSA